MSSVAQIANYILFSACIFILIGSIIITFKMKFIQIRFFPSLFKIIWQSISKKNVVSEDTILPYRALFTAMSTTLGIGTIAGPIVAISWGGPGALVGFLLSAFFGSAVTYLEVFLCIKFRRKNSDGSIQGGPMPYIRRILNEGTAKWYALFGCVVMTAWSSAQANQLGAILSSPLLGSYSISTTISGVAIASLVLLTLIGGIKRVSSFSAKLVPTMFTLYVGASLWILLSHMHEIPAALQLVWSSLFEPTSLARGAAVGGVVSALRWGIFKGTQATEAGVGTQTVPHSMAATNDPIAQGMLAMVSTYTAGLVSFISGLVVIVTGTWLDPEVPLGISMMAASFEQYFSTIGLFIIILSTLLFAFGTTLGNSYNGSQFFGYLASQARVKYYYIAACAIIFIGTIAEVEVVWSLVDIALALIVVPHMFCLLKFCLTRQNELLKDCTEVVYKID